MLETATNMLAVYAPRVPNPPPSSSSSSSSSSPFRRLGELDEALGPCQEATHTKVKSCRYKEVVEYGRPRPSSL